MNCENCGAPLPPKSGLCKHCGTLNEIDLRGVIDAAAVSHDEVLACPQCGGRLEALAFNSENRLVIERCPDCFGLFFDPGELDETVRATVAPAGSADRERLQHILDEEGPEQPPAVRYINCPVCHSLMNRRLIGLRSGVVIDECREHGIWLNGGELRRILKWTKIGGPAIDAEKRRDTARATESIRKLDEKLALARDRAGRVAYDDPDESLVGLIASFILNWIMGR
ncbi:MAG: zf-TFIIB domain-containing protein [Planctomycetes bacterium]|nr:zf-TFIIB domain-containing protein [Planctomycetota bacterium]